MIIHNFIRLYQKEEDLYNVETDMDDNDDPNQNIYEDTSTQAMAEALRSDIAKRMWDDYMIIVNENNL